MHFRPPAKAILQHLPQGAELKLEREPFNEFDPQAVRVLARIAQVPEGQHASLGIACEGFGFSLEETLAKSEHQLGYIAAKLPKGFAPDGISLAAQVAAALDASRGYSARLIFDASGKPLVEIEWSAERPLDDSTIHGDPSAQ